MGQAKRRGTFEQRVLLKLQKYNNLPLVNLHRINSNSSDLIKNKFIEYNVDYLSQLDSKLKIKCLRDTKLELEQYTIKKMKAYENHPTFFLYAALDHNNNMIGFVTVHQGSSSKHHTGCSDTLVEDIYVAPEYRHQGYMTAIRKMTQSKQSLVDRLTLINNFNYYEQIGIKTFKVLYYKDCKFPMLSKLVAVRYDLAGDCKFTIDNLKLVEQQYRLSKL
jgi:hypothetical protein